MLMKGKRECEVNSKEELKLNRGDCRRDCLMALGVSLFLLYCNCCLSSSLHSLLIHSLLGDVTGLILPLSQRLVPLNAKFFVYSSTAAPVYAAVCAFSVIQINGRECVLSLCVTVCVRERDVQLHGSNLAP